MTGASEYHVPGALAETVHRWNARGKPPQPGSSWSRTSWARAFPPRRSLFDALPDRISRAEAAAYGDAIVDAESAERAFLVAMIWGYGPVGYGPYRTARVLGENPDPGARLAEIAAVARERGALAAFEHVAERRMRYLGVAFGTKFLYFATAGVGADPQAAAPILDAVVCRWLSAHAGLELNIETWRPGQYRRYLDALTAWSTRLSVAPSVLEELIFRDGVGREGSATWGEGWTNTDEPLEPAELADAAFEAIAVLRGLFGAADADTAERALPHLDGLQRLAARVWPDGDWPSAR